MTEVDETGPETNGHEEKQGLCLRCLTPNPPHAKLCAGCGAPLSDFASTVPWEFGRYGTTAARTTADPRARPIVFFGIWCWFGPTCFIAAYMLLEAVTGLLDPRASIDRVGAITMGFVAAIYFVISAWALWVVTRRFFSAREGGNPDGGSG